MTIKAKLILNNLLAAVMIIVLVVLSWFAMQQMTEFQDNGAKKSRDAVLMTELSHIGMSLYQTIARVEIDRDSKMYAGEFADKKKRHFERLEQSAGAVHTVEEKKAVENIASAYRRLTELFEVRMIPLLGHAGDVTSEVRQIDILMHKELGIIRDQSIILCAQKIKDSDGDRLHFNAAMNTRRTIILAIGAISLVLLIVFAGIIVNSIMKPLRAVQNSLKDIAQGEGDLTKHLDSSGNDELADISRCINQFISKLNGIMTKVAQTSSHVASASSRLYSTAEQIASGSEEVAVQTGTVATASQEMSATSVDIARSCQLTVESSGQAEAAASESAFIVMESINIMNTIAEQVRESAATVSSLGERSDQIGAIVSTIEDIADQTNLLALNAAIEAARAGEQGRGFAVVADEVRALAERTTRATREISEMIKSIQGETSKAVSLMNNGVAEVEFGVQESAKSSEALVNVLTRIGEVATQVAQIATAAEEQTATTNEITRNIQQITDVVQNTARGATETAGASSELARHANELQNLVGQFKL